MNNGKLPPITEDQLRLKKVTQNEEKFINVLFRQTDVGEKYVLPEHIQKEDVFNYMLDNIRKGTGFTWIIYIKGVIDDIDSSRNEWPIGFVSMEATEQPTTVQITFALLPSFRHKGIMQITCEQIFRMLKNVGVNKVQARIDMANDPAVHLAIRLDFEVNNNKTEVKTDISEGIVNVCIRYLWERQL